MFVTRRIALAAIALAAASAYPLVSNAQEVAPACGFSGESAGNRLEIVGLTNDQRLICFSENRTRKARTIGFVSGLVDDTGLIGIDYRVQDGGLYGVGNAGGVYTIDPASGAAVKVNQLTVALSGFSFGVDFNPAADRLRIVSNSGQNLRHNVNVGGITVLDTALSYTVPPATPAVTAVGVTGAAYTNNDLDSSTATTLFDLDSELDQIAVQSPANAGLLAATGKLGVAADALSSGFDIYSTLISGTSVSSRGYAVIRSAAEGNRLYRIDLLTGKAQARGDFPATDDVLDIAIPLNQP